MGSWCRIIALAALLGGLAGCRSVAPSVKWQEAETLAENERVPQQYLSKNYGATWLRIANLKYDAAVRLAGSVDTEGRVRFYRLLEEPVDARHLQLAQVLLGAVELPRSAVGEVRGSAEVQLFFYETDRMQPDVLIVAWRKPKGPFATTHGKTFYCKLVSL